MAFETGTASDRNDLLSKLKTFAENNGWTTDLDTISSDGRLSIHINNVYIHFDTTSENRAFPTNWGLSDETDNIIVAAQSSSYNSGNAVNYYGHPDSLVTNFVDSNRAELRRLDTSFGYQFFSGGAGDPDYIYMVVEGKADQYTHLMFGDIDKAGSYTGGEFMLNTKWQWWSQVSQGYLSSQHNSFLGSGITTSSTFFVDESTTIHPDRSVLLDIQTFSIANIVSIGLATRSFNAHIIPTGQIGPSGITPLFSIPVMISLQDALSSDDYLYLGEIPNMKLCSLAGRSARDEVTIGADTWVLYPFMKNGSVREIIPDSSSGGTIWQNEGPSSGNAGFAIKKVI